MAVTPEWCFVIGRLCPSQFVHNKQHVDAWVWGEGSLGTSDEAGAPATLLKQ